MGYRTASGQTIHYKTLTWLEPDESAAREEFYAYSDSTIAGSVVVSPSGWTSWNVAGELHYSGTRTKNERLALNALLEAL